MKILVVLFLIGSLTGCSKADAQKAGQTPKCSPNGKCEAALPTAEKKCRCTENGGKCECPNGQCKCTENGGKCECAPS